MSIEKTVSGVSVSGVSAGWLAGLAAGDEVGFVIRAPGGLMAEVLEKGDVTISRAGRRNIELARGVFDGQISRATGSGRDGRGRTIFIMPSRTSAS